ncbi:hypothetical protein HELRODRAFT_97921 [Helobdella robusta]|uniref:E2 ubiquitin-conjugating enzyme n=1 Tax=Helobdella robusta TaxID=6412 RepID=T1G9J5_HELRO|nr:hypothetical protein HELRODRAFT_97921 [Helobdella robusta]ESO09129.1 hypothetical protein HELRODRAFT_97921 [Helobdella robusta]
MELRLKDLSIGDHLMNEYALAHPVSCVTCNGYYGPNYGQPLCTTCHLFLYPQFNLATEVHTSEKSDSYDSGNEEPTTESDFYPAQWDSTSVIFSTNYNGNSSNNNLHNSNQLEERLHNLSNARNFSLETTPPGLVDSLPTEVLFEVFAYLDDIALWNARSVCKRWQEIIDDDVTEEKWMNMVHRRWPLFKAKHKINSWKNVYSKLFQGTTCLYCLDGHIPKSLPTPSGLSFRYSRLVQERKNLRADPLDGIDVQPLDHLYFNWQASIAGPRGSPYEGGIFFLHLQIPPSYPLKPPYVHFLTKIFHPNISCHGDVGLDSLHDNWSLALTIVKVLISIQSLLTDPYSFVCMEPKIGKLYRQDFLTFDKIARLWTRKYATY